jgi:hypothetical protein
MEEEVAQVDTISFQESARDIKQSTEVKFKGEERAKPDLGLKLAAENLFDQRKEVQIKL